jgi:chromosome segregation ATPase
MHRYSLLLGFLLLASTGFGQTSQTDSQTLQALLAEVRQLRQELQTQSTTAQRTQILFFRIQTEQAAVARASQRAEDARAKLAETQSARKKLESEAKGVHDRLENPDNAAERKDLEGMVTFYKRRSEELGEEEQQRQAKQVEVEEQLRLAQAKLDDLQARLDELDKALQKSSQRPTVGPLPPSPHRLAGGASCNELVLA